MEYGQEDEFIIKVFLGAILIILLILLVFIAIRQPTNTSSTVVISNSYNTYAYSYEDDKADRDYRDRDYKRTRHRETRQALDYDDWSRTRVLEEGIFGNKVDIYEVYVKNTEEVGGYFTVRFYFEDYYGDIDTEKMTHYISPGERKMFSYRDVYTGGHDYSDWRYKVISESSL